MTKTKTHSLTEQIAETDRNLRSQVESAQDIAETATLCLDMHRYACVAHPDGPKLSQSAYAALVGVKQPTISLSVNAVKRSLESGYIQLDMIAVPTAPGSTPEKSKKKATKSSADSHKRSRTQAKHGDERSLCVESLAAVFGATPGTVGNGNQTHWKNRLRDCQARARDLAAEDGRDVNEDDAVTAATEIKAAYDLYAARLDRIKVELTANRVGLHQTVTKPMITDLYVRAERLAERTDIGLDQAISDLLDFDAKETAVDRETARIEATRAHYVREIEQGLSTMAVGGARVQKAMVAAKGELNVTDDEIATFNLFMTRVRGALNALDLLITGNGDWDAAAASLTAELA